MESAPINIEMSISLLSKLHGLDVGPSSAKIAQHQRKEVAE